MAVTTTRKRKGCWQLVLNMELKALYTEKFLKDTLNLLKDNLKDLELWSVWNEDKYQVTISVIKEKIFSIEQSLKGGEKNER